MAKTSTGERTTNLRRSTRSSNKETVVSDSTVQKATTATTAAKSMFYVTTRYFTYYLPGTQKRKEPDEPVEQAKKRPHIDQVGIPGGRNDIETPSKTVGPMEQGKLTYRHKPCQQFLTSWPPSQLKYPYGRH